MTSMKGCAFIVYEETKTLNLISGLRLWEGWSTIMFFEEDEYEYKMVAPDIDRLIKFFDHGYMNATASTPALLAAIKPLFELLKELKPHKKNDEAKTIWIRIPRGSIDDYDSFEDMKDWGIVETYEEYLKEWEYNYPEEYCWYELIVFQVYNKKDKKLRYYGMSLGNNFIISASLEETCDVREVAYREEAAVKLCDLIHPAVEESMRLLKEGKYNNFVEKFLPYEFRTGVIKRSDLWESDCEYKKSDYDGLSDEMVKRFIHLIKSGANNPDKIGRIIEFTANDFFKACKLGYEAIGKECDGYSLSDLYMHYSDGRDEGLTGNGHGLNAGSGIDFEDSKAWDEWFFNRKQHGGHPWEVVPGGNSTHMSLGVRSDRSSLEFDLRLGKISQEEFNEQIKKAGYYFVVDGIHRAFESINFYLTLYDAGLPVIIDDAEELVASFEGSDYVGIVPHNVFPRYCASLFPKEYGVIFDFMHVYKSEDAWFDKVKWLPEDPAEMQT